MKIPLEEVFLSTDSGNKTRIDAQKYYLLSDYYKYIFNFSLYPEDLIPFTRKPLFVIVESHNSEIFQSIPNVFNQPLICLMSPTKLPEHLNGKKYLI